MNKISTKFYIWVLMALGMHTTRAAAQTPTDSAYERTMLRLATSKHVFIDTVNITDALKSYQWGYYDPALNEIHITHYAENYNTQYQRNIAVLKSRKYIENTLRHEQTHKRNNLLFQRAILKNMVEFVQFRIYDEISARLSNVVQFREQMAEKYRTHGRLVITDLSGREFKKIPTVLRKQIPKKQLYKYNFQVGDTFNDYYIYLTYLVNNPDVLNGPAHGDELDYMIMTAINAMDKHFKTYIQKFADTYAKKPMYVNFKQLAQMHDDAYQELIPNDTTPVYKTPFIEFAPEWYEMGLDITAPAPTPEQIRRAARAAAKRFENGEVRAIKFDELTQLIFTFNGVNYITDCDAATNTAIQQRIDKYMEYIIAEWARDMETFKNNNAFLEAYWADYHHQPRPFTSPLIQTINTTYRAR